MLLPVAAYAAMLWRKVHDGCPGDPAAARALGAGSYRQGDPAPSFGSGADRITLQESELDRRDWVPVAELATFVIPRLGRRLREAHQALIDGATRYLEHGAQALTVQQSGRNSRGGGGLTSRERRQQRRFLDVLRSP